MRSGRPHPTKRGVTTLASAALLLSLASGCAMQQKQTMQNLQRPGPINCSTAPGDLRVLRAEVVCRAGDFSRALALYRSVGVEFPDATAVATPTIQRPRLRG